MKIEILSRFNIEDKDKLGFYGYKSDYKYLVNKTENTESVDIHIECRKLDKEFISDWTDCEDEFDMFEKIIPQKLSFGAYIENVLVGVVISEKRSWNNTIWIQHIQASDNHKKEGIGRSLLNRLADVAKEKGYRAIGLEVQNTNASAIKFYKKLGFEIDGVDISYYTNHDLEQGDVAFFMKRKLI